MIDPQACGLRAIALLAVQEKFLRDLGPTTAPERFAADDQIFRTQVPKAIAALKVMISASATGSKQAVLDSTNAFLDVMVPAVTDALDDVDPTVTHN